MNRRANPALHLDLQRWRMRLVLGLMFAAFASLGLRALYLQGWQTEFLNEQGEKRTHRVVEIPAHRGMITDRRGVPLAVSTPVESIWLNPREANAAPVQIQALASLLGRDPDELGRDFGDTRRSFIYLRRHAPPELASSVQALGIKGVDTRQEYRRYYPSAEVTAQILGMTNIDDQGQEGIELAYQSTLAGVPGKKRVLRDRLGNAVDELELLHLPKHGRDLALSLNLQIQYLAYRELAHAVRENKARGGGVVVLDVTSGEILALANYPSFNPNSRSNLTPAQLRNRAVVDVFEPGSTIKPFLVAAALEVEAIRPSTRIDTGPGWFMVGEKRISDVHPKGVLSVGEAIKVSSNVATAMIAMNMKSEDYWRQLSRLGFGAPPGSGFPGEAGGRLRPHESWRQLDKAALGFGHGISVSLLQLARAYAAIANDGVLMPATLIKRQDAVIGQRVMSADTARDVRQMLEMVTQIGGTAPQARVVGYRTAGKTGTAHKYVNGGFARDRYIASFAGLAPASKPRVVVAVMLDEPSGKHYYGGLVAAPVFANIVAGTMRFMALPPDAPLESLPAPGPVIAEAV